MRLIRYMWLCDKTPTACDADVRRHGGSISCNPVLRLTWRAGAAAEVALGCELVHHEEMLDYVELLGVDAGPASSYIVSVRMSPNGTLHKTQVRLASLASAISLAAAVSPPCSPSMLACGCCWVWKLEPCRCMHVRCPGRMHPS